MALSQNERSKKYLAQFTRPTVKIKKAQYNIYVDFIKKKGYKCIDDYVNSVLAVDIKNNIIPDKKDIEDIINNDN